VEDFASNRPAALPKGARPFGKRELLRGRRNGRSALEQRLREATEAEVAVDRLLLAYLSRFQARPLFAELVKRNRSVGKTT